MIIRFARAIVIEPGDQCHRGAVHSAPLRFDFRLARQRSVCVCILCARVHVCCAFLRFRVCVLVITHRHTLSATLRTECLCKLTTPKTTRFHNPRVFRFLFSNQTEFSTRTKSAPPQSTNNTNDSRVAIETTTTTTHQHPNQASHRTRPTKYVVANGHLWLHSQLPVSVPVLSLQIPEDPQHLHAVLAASERAGQRCNNVCQRKVTVVRRQFDGGADGAGASENRVGHSRTGGVAAVWHEMDIPVEVQHGAVA